MFRNSVTPLMSFEFMNNASPYLSRDMKTISTRPVRLLQFHRPTDRPPPSSHRALRTSHFSLKYLQARLRPCGFRPTWMMTSITSCSGTRSELRDRFSNLGETDRLSNLGERDRLSNHGDRSVVKGCGCDGRNGAAVETGNVV